MHKKLLVLSKGIMSSRGGRGGGRGGKKRPTENAKRATIFEYQKYENRQVRIQFHGGREIIGVLKGHDDLMNLVLDESKEMIRDLNDLTLVTDRTRDLGLVVCRGTQIVMIAPVEGTKEIPNPFDVAA